MWHHGLYMYMRRSVARTDALSALECRVVVRYSAPHAQGCPALLIPPLGMPGKACCERVTVG